MTNAKVYPYINRFSGEIEIMTRQQAKELNEDWAVAKVVKNKQGAKVFRFHLSAPIKGRDGKVHMGTAIIDLSEQDTPKEMEQADGKRNTK